MLPQKLRKQIIDKKAYVMSPQETPLSLFMISMSFLKMTVVSFPSLFLFAIPFILSFYHVPHMVSPSA